MRIVVTILVLALVWGAVAPAVAAGHQQPSSTLAGADETPVTAPAGSDADACTGGEEYDIAVTGGSLPFDVGRTFAGVEQRVGRDVEPPDTIEFTSDFNWDSEAEPDRFERLLGVEPRPVTYYGAADRDGRLLLNPVLEERPVLAEVVLAHEFAHLAQYQTDEDVDYAGESYDGQVTRRAVLEGAASYVAQDYWERCIQEEPSTEQVHRETYRDGSVIGKLNEAPYWFGYRFADRTVNSPEAAVTLHHAEGPETGEQLLHGLEPASEPPVPLAVSVVAPGEWEPTHEGARGEMFARVVLQAALDRSTAKRAAAGWGNDSVVRFDGPEEGYAWVLRWDDAANASEFETAFEEFLDRRADRTDDGWRGDDGHYRLVRADDRTTVVLLGPEDLVANTAVSADGAAVTLAPSGSEALTPEDTPTATATDGGAATTDPAPDTAATSTATDEPGVPIPGFGFTVALAALFATALAVGRRT